MTRILVAYPRKLVKSYFECSRQFCQDHAVISPQKKSKRATGEKVRKARDSKGWSQEGLCRRLRELGYPLSKTGLSNIENGISSPKTVTLVWIAKACEKPLSFFFDDGAAMPIESLHSIIDKILAAGGKARDDLLKDVWRHYEVVVKSELEQSEKKGRLPA